jgi:hypothetical protein
VERGRITRATYESALSKVFLALNQLSEIAQAIGEEGTSEDARDTAWMFHSELERSVRKPNGRRAYVQGH